MIVNEDFLAKKFGDCEYAAARTVFDPRGVIITDYVADLILAKNKLFKNRSYDYIIENGVYINGQNVDTVIINAIIDTGYRQKHKDLYDRVNSGNLAIDHLISNDSNAAALISDIYDSLGYCYTTNQKFAEDINGDEDSIFANVYVLSANKVSWSTNTGTVKCVSDNGSKVLTNARNTWRYTTTAPEIPEGAKITDFCSVAVETLSYCTFYDEDKCIISCETVSYTEMPENSMILSYDAYNSIFGTTYASNNADEFVPHTADISQFMRGDVDQENPLVNGTITILGVGSLNLASDDLFAKLRKNTYFEYALYLDGIDNLGSVLEFLSLTYKNHSVMIESVHTMTRAVEVFVPIFELIAIFLCIGIILILISFSSRMIKNKMHEIGILKALGTKNRSITTIFGLQVMLITALTCIMATVGYYFFIDLANDVLIDSLKRLAPNHVVLDLEFLTFIPKIAAENCVLVCLLSIISLIFPMIKIKAIKPVKIIKVKE